MRPLHLLAQERAITCLKYNKEGDLLFSGSKDKFSVLWRVRNGERLGVYKGHDGAVSNLDVTDDSQFLFTAGTDSTCRQFRVSTGELIQTYNHSFPLRCVAVSESATMFATSDKPLGGANKQLPALHIWKVGKAEPEVMVELAVGGGAISLFWSPLDENLIVGCEDGKVRIFPSPTWENPIEITAHDNALTSLTPSYDKMMFITTSSDGSAKLFDTHTREVVASFATDRPLNSASISPDGNYVILGGGVRAADVTSSTAAKMETLFYNTALMQEIGRVKGAFGTLNSVAICPDNLGFVIGGEDGYIRLHFFDPDFLSKIRDQEDSLRETVEFAEKDAEFKAKRTFASVAKLVE